MRRWADTTNGRSHSELKDPLGGDTETFIGAVLGRMDGIKLFAWSIWRLPEGASIETVDLRRWPQEYLQCAGAADGMVVEVRRELQPGEYAHETVGRAVPDALALPREREVSWDEFRVMAASNEILSADEAREIFVSYFSGEELPENYTVRPVASNS